MLWCKCLGAERPSIHEYPDSSLDIQRLPMYMLNRWVSISYLRCQHMRISLMPKKHSQAPRNAVIAFMTPVPAVPTCIARSGSQCSSNRLFQKNKVKTSPMSKHIVFAPRNTTLSNIRSLPVHFPNSHSCRRSNRRPICFSRVSNGVKRLLCI